MAVDGFNGLTGDVVLSWNLDETDAVLPVIIGQPLTTTGVIGQAAELEVRLEVETDGIDYQWFKDGNLISDETAKRLVFDNVSLSDVGVYSVRITSGGESIASDDARLLVQYDENAPDANVNTKLDLGSLVGASGGGK